MHRPINQICNDLFALGCGQVLNALEPPNHLLSIGNDLFLDVVKDYGQAGPNLLKLLHVDLTVVLKRNATSQIKQFFNGDFFFLCSRLVPFKCVEQVILLLGHLGLYAGQGPAHLN